MPRAAYFFLFWLNAKTIVMTNPTSATSSEPNWIISVKASLTSTGITSLPGD